MFKVIWKFWKEYRRRGIEIDLRLLDDEIVKASTKLVVLLSEQRELQRLERIDKCGGKLFSVDDFIRLHTQLPLKVKWAREEFDELAARRDKLERKLVEGCSFFVTVA